MEYKLDIPLISKERNLEANKKKSFAKDILRLD